MKNARSVIALCALSLFFYSGGVQATFSQKAAEQEQFINRHLDSIGSKEARQGLKSLTAVGTAAAIFRGRGEGRAEGIVVIASEGNKNMLGMKFNNSDYPLEKLGFDGENFRVAQVRPGAYSVFGQFLRNNEKTFKTGIFGGVLATSWELLSFDESSGRLRSRGKTKINGVDTLRYEFSPKKGSDLDITLYFDAATHRHVRTEYKRVISAPQGSNVDASSRQSELRYRMVEDFSDFGVVGNLTLPHTYSIQLETHGGQGSTSYTWTIELAQFTFNQPIDVKDFSVDSY